MKTVGITYDLERGNYPIGAPLRVPVPGELLASVRKDGDIGQHYEIVTVREVRSRNPTAQPRFALRCRRVGWPSARDHRHTWYLVWYPRSRRDA